MGVFLWILLLSLAGVMTGIVVSIAYAVRNRMPEKKLSTKQLIVSWISYGIALGIFLGAGAYGGSLYERSTHGQFGAVYWVMGLFVIAMSFTMLLTIQMTDETAVSQERL